MKSMKKLVLVFLFLVVGVFALSFVSASTNSYCYDVSYDVWDNWGCINLCPTEQDVQNCVDECDDDSGMCQSDCQVMDDDCFWQCAYEKDDCLARYDPIFGPENGGSQEELNELCKITPQHSSKTLSSEYDGFNLCDGIPEDAVNIVKKIKFNTTVDAFYGEDDYYAPDGITMDGVQVPMKKVALKKGSHVLEINSPSAVCTEPSRPYTKIAVYPLDVSKGEIEFDRDCLTKDVLVVLVHGYNWPPQIQTSSNIRYQEEELYQSFNSLKYSINSNAPKNLNIDFKNFYYVNNWFALDLAKKFNKDLIEWNSLKNYDKIYIISLSFGDIIVRTAIVNADKEAIDLYKKTTLFSMAPIMGGSEITKPLVVLEGLKLEFFYENEDGSRTLIQSSDDLRNFFKDQTINGNFMKELFSKEKTNYLESLIEHHYTFNIFGDFHLTGIWSYYIGNNDPINKAWARLYENGFGKDGHFEFYINKPLISSRREKIPNFEFCGEACKKNIHTGMLDDEFLTMEITGIILDKKDKIEFNFENPDGSVSLPLWWTNEPSQNLPAEEQRLNPEREAQREAILNAQKKLLEDWKNQRDSKSITGNAILEEENNVPECNNRFDNCMLDCTSWCFEIFYGTGYEDLCFNEENGCSSDCSFEQEYCDKTINGCSQIGERYLELFCSTDSVWQPQKPDNSNCENKWECLSDKCINNQCISQTLWQRILDWIKNIFG